MFKGMVSILYSFIFPFIGANRTREGLQTPRETARVMGMPHEMLLCANGE